MQKRVFLPILFASFLFADAAYSQISPDLPFRGDTAGIVNGRVLTRKAYLDKFSDVTWQTPGEKKHPLSDSELLEARRKTWDQLVTGAIIEDSIEKKGITITDAEVWSVLENDPPEFLKNNFKDSSGTFHKPEYLQTLHDPVNDTIVRKVINTMKPEMRKQKFAEMLLARIPPVTDDELWQEYKDQKDATRKKFESEKEVLRSKKQGEKNSAFFSNWIAMAKANAKIIDYRTVK